MNEHQTTPQSLQGIALAFPASVVPFSTVGGTAWLGINMSKRRGHTEAHLIDDIQG